MRNYITTIGLEIHAELKTKSKMFCGCTNDPDQEQPNVYVCPVCTAHPGTLPVINQEAVRQVLRVGTAVGGTIADFTEFDRKNYFYPDIPKAYQISQYKYPLISGGMIGDVDITRIHLEEDTASSAHGDSTSNVNFNRAGVPLMELVTEPVIHDAGTAVAFARDLRLLLKYLGASDANLEKGEMRIEANISIAPEGDPLGTKVEVKNLNSFKAVEQAIVYETKRHAQVLSEGGALRQETRGWDENKQKTFSQRAKEESHDYRYFPDPDLPKLYLSEISLFAAEEIQKSLPELPWELRKRYVDQGMSRDQVETLVANTALNTLYGAVHALLSNEKQRSLAANYLTSDLVGILGGADYGGRPIEALSAAEFGELIQLIDNGTLSSRGAKNVLAAWMERGGSPELLAKEMNLVQISDTAQLAGIIATIIQENEKAVTEYRAGKEAAVQYLVGQGMKATKGAANPGTLKELILKQLDTS